MQQGKTGAGSEKMSEADARWESMQRMKRSQEAAEHGDTDYSHWITNVHGADEAGKTIRDIEARKQAGYKTTGGTICCSLCQGIGAVEAD